MQIIDGYKSGAEFYADGSWIRDVYVRTGKLHLRCFNGLLQLTEVENALKTGAYCEQYSLSGTFDELEALLHRHRHDLLSVLVGLKEVLAGQPQDVSTPLKDGGSCSWAPRAANRTFSPFGLERLKPLKWPVAGKWTLSHARRALANGQFENLRCNGVYTDDHAGDAAADFRRGAITAPLEFLSKLVESPSGWWSSLDEDSMRVNVCCHSFDSNSFILKPAKLAPLKP